MNTSVLDGKVLVKVKDSTLRYYIQGDRGKRKRYLRRASLRRSRWRPHRAASLGPFPHKELSREHSTTDLLKQQRIRSIRLQRWKTLLVCNV